jgi:ELWxxDGT repeat protein
VNGSLFFTADDGVHGRELWKSDGTAAGTVMVKDICPVPDGDPSPQDLTPLGGSVYFTADDGIHGRQLWKSDGTAAGTGMVEGTIPYQATGGMVLLGNTLVFVAQNMNTGVAEPSQLYMNRKPGNGGGRGGEREGGSSYP